MPKNLKKKVCVLHINNTHIIIYIRTYVLMYICLPRYVIPVQIDTVLLCSYYTVRTYIRTYIHFIATLHNIYIRIYVIP